MDELIENIDKINVISKHRASQFAKPVVFQEIGDGDSEAFHIRKDDEYIPNKKWRYLNNTDERLQTFVKYFVLD